MNRGIRNFLIAHKTLSNRLYSSHSIQIYNTLTKQKEPLILRNKNVLNWYSCGPTVYDSAHIGHASSYVNFDIIKRILRNYFHINVVNLMNITDIDDKIIRKANQEKKLSTEVSRKYEKEFLVDLNSLNCEPPSIILRVTEHIPQIIAFIEKLIASKHAYVTTSGSVYFNQQAISVKSFILPTETVSEFDSKDNKEKRHPHDFSLWKSRKKSNEPSWKSPWGIGRPGWHIECSTLASIAFGQHLDFHSGGKDLIFPHHQNEMIQCCAFHNLSTWSRTWLHTGHLHLKDDVKMSKSLQNTVSIRDLLVRYTSDQFRLFCLISPYRYDKEFSEDKMTKSVQVLKSFISFLKLCNVYTSKEIDMPVVHLNEAEVYDKLNSISDSVHNALSDDFNTCLAIEKLSDLVLYMNRLFQNTQANVAETSIDTDLNRHYGCVMSVAMFVKGTLEMFGLNMDIGEKKADRTGETLRSSELIEAALKFRSSIRNLALSKESALNKEAKDAIFKFCDEFRYDFGKANVEFKDHKNQTIWQIKK